MKYLFAASIACILGLVSCREQVIVIPPAFIETAAPVPMSEQWQQANQSSKEFRVRNIDGTLAVDPDTGSDPRCTLNIEDGTLLGVDHGEFGGAFMFLPKNAGSKQIIKQGNTRFIFRYKNKVYFIQGYSHMGYYSGGLYELSRQDTTFNCKMLVDFRDSPEAFTVYKDQLLIAANRNFFIVRDFKKELICTDVFWQSLYPNSIAAFNDSNIFIGMRSGIAKLNLSNKKLTYYKWVGN